MEIFDRLAEQYQGEHSANPHQTALVERVSERLPAGSSVLDLGCGTGVPTARILTAAGHRVLGVDISGGMLEVAREQVPAAEFQQGDFRDLPAGAGPFDAVTSFFSLLMLSREDIEAVLRKAAGWLSPGGLFAVGMVNLDADSLPIEFLGVPVRVSGYPEPLLREKLEAAGLAVESIATVDFTPPNGPAESQIYALCRKA
jgi:ubiquinone/menaquinone biosynthesis C-methylase UbiE